MKRFLVAIASVASDWVVTIVGMSVIAGVILLPFYIGITYGPLWGFGIFFGAMFGVNVCAELSSGVHGR